jgi:hypothetical protein
MSETWVLILTSLALRLSALLNPSAWAVPVAPLGPLGAWLQPFSDAPQAGWSGPAWILLQAFCDAASALLIMRLVERRRLAERLLAPAAQSARFASPAFWAGLAWAVHPVAGLLAGPLGVWQSLGLLGLLLAAWNLEFSTHPAAEARAAWVWGLASSAALWPVLLLPLGGAGFLSRRARLRFYGQALLLPLLLLLPWLFLKDPATVEKAWKGPVSLLGVPGVLRSLWSAAGAPASMLSPLLKAWELFSLMALVSVPLFWLWRAPALLPGLGLGAWLWVLLSPQPQEAQLLAALALLLLLPGGLAWRMAAISFFLLILHRWLPGLRDLEQGPTGGSWRGVQLGWSALLLAWLFWTALTCLRLNTDARRPHRASQYF